MCKFRLYIKVLRKHNLFHVIWHSYSYYKAFDEIGRFANVFGIGDEWKSFCKNYKTTPLFMYSSIMYLYRNMKGSRGLNYQEEIRKIIKLRTNHANKS